MLKLVVYNTHSSRVIVVMVLVMMKITLLTSMVLTIIVLLCVLPLVINSNIVLGVLIWRLPHVVDLIAKL